jgi:hypothetical protein
MPWESKGGTDHVLLSNNLSHGLFWARRLCNLHRSKSESFGRSTQGDLPCEKKNEL